MPYYEMRLELEGQETRSLGTREARTWKKALLETAVEHDLILVDDSSRHAKVVDGEGRPGYLRAYTSTQRRYYGRGDEAHAAKLGLRGVR